MATTRRRVLPRTAGLWTHTYVDIDRFGKPGPAVTDRTYIFEFPVTQVTESEGHPWRRYSRKRKRQDKSDVGGEFFTQKSYVLDPSMVLCPPMQFANGLPPAKRIVQAGNIPGLAFPLAYMVSSSVPGVPKTYKARLIPSSYPPAMLDDDWKSLGTTAIARVKPTKSPADLSTTVTELTREGLPSMVGKSVAMRKASLRSAGSEHLNYQFGIKPILSDVKSTAGALGKIDHVIDQFERDAGKVVRRKYTFPTESELVFTQDLGNVDPASNIGGLYMGPSASNRIVMERRRTRRVWFSGAMTYTLPPGMHGRSALKDALLKADRLGADLDLETIWNVAPWSWAVDWFSNAGDFVSNVNDVAKYGLTLVYGYVMVHTVVQDTYTWTGGLTQGQNPLPFPAVSTTLVTETKERHRATPFGFGVDMSSLSGLQLSILGALGISRGR